MGRIYTRSGDKGTTAIHGGRRVAKTDVRIEANGTLDELNVAVGMVRTSLPKDHIWQEELHDIQVNLMKLMSLVATPDELRSQNPNVLSETLVEELESLIDRINKQCTPPDCFILPGGTPVASLLHYARVIARKAERRLWRLNEADAVPAEILKYINRLSDLFFIMARYELQHSGCDEEVWQKFGYKLKMK
ncbi:MAG: cob(I)yrinic acid a,c-diamide adenosyltransferase [Muribaculaceae bacterium]|nr:cob(I)yrinic acid a,c-diamide adenosyltransferase [Muribaculaceae bacterium]